MGNLRVREILGPKTPQQSGIESLPYYHYLDAQRDLFFWDLHGLVYHAGRYIFWLLKKEPYFH